MASPLQHVVAGEQPNRAVMSLVECYLVALDRYETGTVITADLANEAIDWWRSLGDYGRLDAAEAWQEWRDNR